MNSKTNDGKSDYCECGRLRTACVGGFTKNRNTLHGDRGEFRNKPLVPVFVVDREAYDLNLEEGSAQRRMK
jgi:hypothetical protein